MPSPRRSPSPATSSAPSTAPGPLRRDLLVLAAATLISLAPFLGKPLHIDDPLFVWSAQHIAQQPLDFYGFDVVWGRVSTPMHQETQNPPLVCYWLALGGELLGWSELALHAWMLPWTLAAVWGVYVLARQWRLPALWIALATLATPMFLVSATTLMSDVPMLALWCWSLAAWVHGVDRDTWRGRIAGASLAGAALLTKYFAVALLPLLAVYSLARRKRPTAELALLSLPLVVMALYQLVTWRLYGVGLFGQAADYALQWGSQRNVALGESVAIPAGERFWVGLLFVGGGCWPLMTQLARRGQAKAWGVALVGAALLALALTNAGLPASLRLRSQGALDVGVYAHQLAFGLAGVATLALALVALVTGRHQADQLTLALWALGTLVFAALVNWTCNARSVLPLVPAVAMLAARGGLFLNPHWRWGLMAIGWAASMLVAQGDDAYARAAKRAAVEVVAAARQASPEGRVWFQGHWGWQYYADRAGATIVDFRRATIEPRDLLLMPHESYGLFEFGPDLAETRFRKEITAPAWAVTVGERDAVGFYASIKGPLPYRFARQSPQTYTALALRRTLDIRGRDEPAVDAAEAAPARAAKSLTPSK